MNATTHLKPASAKGFVPTRRCPRDRTALGLLLLVGALSVVIPRATLLTQASAMSAAILRQFPSAKTAPGSVDARGVRRGGSGRARTLPKVVITAEDPGPLETFSPSAHASDFVPGVPTVPLVPAVPIEPLESIPDARH